MRYYIITIFICCISSLFATAHHASAQELELQRQILSPDILQTQDWQLSRSTAYTWVDSWNPNTRNLYSYRADGQMAENLTQEYSQGLWQDFSNTLYTYDALDRNIQITTYHPDGTDWANYMKFERIYDGELMTSQDRFLWLENSWQQTGTTTYIYEGSQIVTEKYFTLLAGNMTLMLQIHYEHDDEGRLSLIYYQYPSSPQMPRIRIVYSYDNDLVTELLYQEELQADLWADYARYLYSYDANSEISQILTQNYSGTWTDQGRQIYSYLENCSIREIVSQAWEAGSWQNLTKTVDERNSVSISEELAPQLVSNLRLYPNPMREGIWIEEMDKTSSGLRLDIYNLKGQKIKSISPSSTKSFWDARDKRGNIVPPGVYILKQGTRTYRMLKL